MENVCFEFECALRLSREKGVGASGFRRLIEQFGKPSVALKKWQEEIAKKTKLMKVSKNKNTQQNMLLNSLYRSIGKECFTAYYSGPDYPEQLKCLTEPPPVIYTTSPLKDARFAAVVGTRKASGECLEMARQMTLRFISDGYAIISGGAVGIDCSAHKTALEAGAYTVAVLGNGIDVVYPRENAELFEQIKANGALMTELMVGTQPMKSFFPTRNRIIAAMADIVIVIGAKPGSGSMITANWARKLKKRLIMLPL